MKKKFKFYWDILLQTYKSFMKSNAFFEASGLAYSAIFSVPGLLIIVIWFAGFFFGEEVIRGEITRQIRDAIGADAAKSLQEILKEAMIDKDNFWMKMIGILALVFGATTLFFKLQIALNHLWGIKPNPKKAMKKYVLDRATSLGIIIILGLLMAITMILSSIISGLSNFITDYFGMRTYTIAQILNFGVGFLLVMAIFSIIFKVLPDVEIQWRAVYTGAFVTAILFTIGKFLLSYYFSEFEPASIYGTAGSVVLIMMWINYSFLILLFGAQFTKINALKKDLNFEPSDHAEWSNKDRLLTSEDL